MRPDRAELGGGQGAAEPAAAAGSGWGMEPAAATGRCLTEGRGEQGGEEEDQCMTCGSHQTEANGTRSLLMLILPTK